jgi:hypothetical protein
LDDLIVGAKGANPNDRSNAGKSYIVFGKADSSAIDLSTIADANNPTSCRVVCISNGAQINSTAAYLTKHNIRFT